MTQNLMDDYVRTMKSVGSDDASLTRIQRAVARERARSASAPAASGRTDMSARTASASAPAPCRGLRIAAVAACTALLALGGAFALPRLMGRGAPVTPVAGMQGFVLAAYADGSAVEDGENTVMTSTDIFKNSGGWSEGDNDVYETAYTIDPSILGNDVVSVEYRSTNENVVLEGMRDRRKVLPGESAGTEYLSSITVGGPNATLSDLYQLDLRVSVPATDTIKEADEAYNELGNAGIYDEELSDRLGLEVQRACAEELASGTLEITATFADRSTQTHVYRIAPVEDFEQLWWKDRAARRASFDDEDADYEPLQLFALQQVE
ncbi:hypothetical protein [Collinsella intestinalis]|uniref:hypothetical protein n=1 Tax=Collinsella intestinalis TaxID=147207 RepID=UPI00241D1E5C|nr:hypothetical protein [Collinsella intestinalis]